MSTALQSRALPRGATDVHRLKNVLWSLVIGLRPMLLGYWAVMVVALFLGGLAVQLVTSGVTTSAWDYGTQSPKGFAVFFRIRPRVATGMRMSGM